MQMNEMQVQCPSCGQVLTITDDQRNIQLMCPVCRKLFVVPGPSPVSPAGFPPVSGRQSSNRRRPVILLGAGLVLLLVLGILIGGIFAFREPTADEGESAQSADVIKTYMSQAYAIGNYVKASFGGGKILLIADPDDKRMDDFAAAMRNGSESEVVIDTIKFPPTGEEMAEPISERMTTKDFEAVVARHGDAKVIVSMIGLPRDIFKHPKLLQDCRAGSGPKIILFSSDVPQLDKMIGAGMVTAAVMMVPPERPDAADKNAALNVRYILIDKSNVAANRSLFGE